MSRKTKFLKITRINCHESKKNHKVTLHGLDIKGSFEWTCNPDIREAEFRNGLDSIPAGSNSPSV